jgi:hypothetical protein
MNSFLELRNYKINHKLYIKDGTLQNLQFWSIYWKSKIATITAQSYADTICILQILFYF